MNGFTNTILSLLLGWLRTLANSFWKLLNSDGGGGFFSFLSANWKTLAVILCIGGFVTDRIIYLIRWRPYYVWSSRLNRLRRGRRADDAPEAGPGGVPEPGPVAPPDPEGGFAETAVLPPANPYMRPDPAPAPGFAPQRPIRSAQSPSAPQPDFAAGQPGFAQATVHYAPIAKSIPKDHTPYHRPYEPPANLEPVFDDDLGGWAEGETLVRPLSQDAAQNPARGMADTFGMPRPEPVDYLRDMQAGFAPPLPPEELYAPRADNPVPAASKGPVHPGLDSAAFRQSFGLGPAGSLPGDRLGEEEADAMDAGDEPDVLQVSAPAFMPYGQAKAEAELKPARLRNPLASIAKKARDLVGSEDEEHKPTIHDLQSTVDMRTAFHEPVYPKPKDHKGGEPS